MKKLFLLIILSVAFITAGAQSLEVRARAGLNIQNSKMQDKEVSTFPHFGISVGKRISTIGIYGELLYSTHEEINGSTTIDYFIPSLQLRLYTLRYLYAEVGLSYAMIAGDNPGGLIENVDKEGGYYVGLGASFRKFEIGFRTASLPVINVQLTASYRF